MGIKYISKTVLLRAVLKRSDILKHFWCLLDKEVDMLSCLWSWNLQWHLLVVIGGKKKKSNNPPSSRKNHRTVPHNCRHFSTESKKCHWLLIFHRVVGNATNQNYNLPIIFSLSVLAYRVGVFFLLKMCNR